MKNQMNLFFWKIEHPTLSDFFIDKTNTKLPLKSELTYKQENLSNLVIKCTLLRSKLGEAHNSFYCQKIHYLGCITLLSIPVFESAQCKYS